MGFRKLASASVVALIVAAAMALGVAAPADAAGLGSDAFGDDNLLNYRTTLTGAALYAQNSTAAKNAWGSNYVQNVTKSAAAARAGAVYGNIESVPDAIPIRQMPDVSLSSKISGRWKVPKFTGIGLTKPGYGTAGAPVAVTAFMYRADIANGVTSWFGIDAAGAVCGNGSWASSGFVNFITGQDCNAYATTQQYQQQANAGIGLQAGYSSTETCTADATWCVKVSGASSWTVAAGGSGLWGPTGYVIPRVCFTTTKGSTGEPHWLQLASGAVQLGNASNGSKWWNANFDSPVCGTANTMAVGWPAQNGSTPDNIVGISNAATQPTASAFTPVVATNPAPPHTVTCKYMFSDGTSASGTTPSYQPDKGEPMPTPVCPFVPSGLSATHMTVTDNAGTASTVLADQAAAPDQLTTVPDGFTSNAPVGVDSTYCQTNVCILDLVDLKSGDTCFDEAATCDGWMSDPNRATDYKCTYGGHDAEMQQCYLYAHIFDTQKRLAGDPYADPKTGDDPGGESGPNLDEQTMGKAPVTAISPDGLFNSCMGGKFSAFNPIEWVLRPIQCGAEWAFAPRQAVLQADVQGVQHAWDNTGPGKMVNAVASWHLNPVMTGCSGYTWPNVYGSGKDLTIANACPGSALASTAAWSRTITGVLMVVGGGLALVSIGSRAFGYHGPDR